MQITRLELRNYKCFEHLVLDNLGDRVVLVGPNGCGKSSILEAVAALKEFVATYDPNKDTYKQHLPLDGVYDTAWPAGVPLPVRGNENAAVINCQLFLSEAEASLGGCSRDVGATVSISKTGRVTLNVNNSGIEKVFRYFDPASGIGTVDYISPSRTFPLERVTNLAMVVLSTDQQRRERVELPKASAEYVKFRAVKQFIISKQLEDLSHFQATGEQRDSLVLLRDLFTHFFSPKVLIGYRAHNDEMQVAVRTPYGEHDIDQLSSGEKELFSIFVNLFRIRSLPSIILYDEPERHLNAGLEAKLLPALDKLQSKNQLWITTHGIELIGSVPLQEIVALKREAGSSQPERFTDESKNARVRLFESLGAKVGLQLVANRIVFLEGKEAHADKRIMDKLAGPKLAGIQFVASGSSADVLGAGSRDLLP